MTTAYTFKEKVADDARKYLGKKDELYPNLKFHTWGEIMPEDIKWDEVHQVHDLVSEKFFYKVPVPFENNFMGMSVESNNAAYIFKNAEDDKDFDLSQLVDGLKKRNDVVAFRIAYPNKYGIQNNLIMLIPRDEYEECSDVKAKEAYIGINAYINLVLRKSIHRTWAEIKNAPTLDDKTLHWIWFRKPGYVLPMEIAERVRSWVDYNPDMSFILWTDLKDEAELGEFLKDAKGVWPDGDKICVKYLEDTLDFVKSYFETHKNEDEVKAFDRETYVGLIQDRVYNRTMIAKTDYLRAMILHHFGGFYADFNDCECFCPIRYWFKELVKKQDLILPCDTFNEVQISNYFIYVPKGSKTFKKLHLATLDGFEGIKKAYVDTTTPRRIAEFFLGYVKKFWRMLKRTETYEPTQLLVDVMFPVFEGSKMTTMLSEAIHPKARLAVSKCDNRAKIFFIIYTFKYLAKKYAEKDVVLSKKLQRFYDHFVEEFKEIATIGLRRAPISVNKEGKIVRGEAAPGAGKFEVNYINRAHSEDWDDLDMVLKIHEEVMVKLEELEEDADYHAFMHREFMRNMVMIAMFMTNFITHIDREMTMKELVPFSYVYPCFTYLSFIGHYGHGTSTGIES